YRPYDVAARDALTTLARLLRRDRGRHRAREQRTGWDPGEHDPRDRLRDHGSRRDEALVRRPVGCRAEDLLGVDHHDSCVRRGRDGRVWGHATHVWRLTEGICLGPSTSAKSERILAESRPPIDRPRIRKSVLRAGGSLSSEFHSDSILGAKRNRTSPFPPAILNSIFTG